MQWLPISVVIPTYNRATLVRRAVQSALAAMRPEDEVIVVDDGSTDDTATVLAAYGNRIRFLRVARGGPGAARNHGVQTARHPLIAFLDSDDEWMSDKLTLQRAVMQARGEVVFCCGGYLSIGDMRRRVLWKM